MSSERSLEVLATESIRVFIVDDHPLVRTGTRKLLELDQRIVFAGEAASGEEALGRVKSASTRVVLMDIRLPGIDGIETTRRLVDQDSELRVVILSAFGDHFLTPAIEAGACGYILKSASQPELVQAVVQAADGQSPLDSSLSRTLFTGYAKMAKMTQNHHLSDRHYEMLRMVSNGMSSKQIQAQLFISEATVKREFRKIFNQLGVNDRAQAVAEAYRRSLLGR